MSDMIESAYTGTESAAAPTSTAEIAASVIQAADAEDHATEAADAADATIEEPKVEPVVEPIVAKKEAPKDLSIEEQLLAEFGFKEARRPDGREHYISRSKVLQMIGSGLKRGQAKWDGERSALEKTTTEVRSDLEQFKAGIKGDPRVFLSDLATYDQRYKAFLEPQAAQTTEHKPAGGDARPEPDVDLGNGSWTYSADQNAKLIQWEARQLLDAELKPWRESQKEAKAKAEADAAETASRTRVRQQTEDAQTWPMFGKIAGDGTYTEFQTAVLKRLQDDTTQAQAAGKRPTMTLREAYLEAYNEYLAADDATRRARLIAEQNKAPKSTSVTRPGADSTRSAQPRTTADIAREVVARAEAGA